MAEALGYADYEEFLDIGRRLSGMEPVRSEKNQHHKSSTEVPALLELLVENRALRIRVDEQRLEMEAMRALLERLEPCDPSVPVILGARAAVRADE